VEASRGCPFGCEFCLSAADGAPRQVREFPLEPFLAEMEALIRRGARGFKFLDRTFNLNIKRAVQILEFFLLHAEKTARTDRPLWVHFEMVPGTLNKNFPPELRETLRHFPPGSLRLEVGIQTLNAETAALIHRTGSAGGNGSANGTICATDALETIAFLRNETAAIVHADLIAGLPGEDFSSFAAGFDRLWLAASAGNRGATAAASFEIQLGILKLLPGAPIARRTDGFGMKYAPDPPYEVMETAALPARDLDRIKNFARFWERIMNRNAFPVAARRLFPPDEPVFVRFMNLSDRLLEHFGRNWGLDKKELRLELEITVNR
jgi:hypothetical protein